VINQTLAIGDCFSVPSVTAPRVMVDQALEFSTGRMLGSLKPFPVGLKSRNRKDRG